MRRAPLLAALVVSSLVLVAACGAPQPVSTYHDSPDYGSVAIPLTHALPTGLSDVGVDGKRLVAGCLALGTRVAALLPNVRANGAGSAARFVSRHCEWTDGTTTPLIVGMLVTHGADADLDQTNTHLDHEESVPGIGTRADYDPDTHTLYVILSDRLWYLQLVGAAAKGANDKRTLIALARDLASSPAAR